MVNDGGGGGGGRRTSFEDKSHEEMLAWLDQASSFHVQEAADRLSAAAGEIRSIAQLLKFRPERVKWEGEGFDAFVEWGASLASSTFRLADYSDEAAKWLGQSSGAIARAQAAIPRYTSKDQAQANLDAAKSHHNDPDASTVAAKAEATLAASQELKRLEAAAEMRKLAQAYDQSASQMDNLEVPTFRPPPAEFVPPDIDHGMGTQDVDRSGGGSAAEYGTGAGYAAPASVMGSAPAPATAAERVPGPEAPPAAVEPSMPPAAMEIDSISTLPPTQTAPQAQPTPGPVRLEGPTNPPVNLVPPVSGGGPVSPSAKQDGTGRIPGAPRGPVLPGQPTGVPGPGSGSARPPRDGIVGGRPVPPASGRSAGIPRGNVIGAESSGFARPPMAHGAGGAGGGLGSGQSRTPGGRPVQTGITGGRPSTQSGSGPARGGIAGTSSRPSSARENTEGERPDYLTEDDETWQQNSRRVVPPVID
ncbi:WXG100 family type VII secretion target [Streptomyces peucetius]|uniref:Translation initiation factor IF-2 n=1 Tax=Streptomyces peucetius TaxID=1950 RepID=A0ABY6I6A2_STRPE|nr:hypothetical protein [Streptomyces peucetius]UYQ62376.1 hypothetical protein OGH68_13385 [Streptomyces peucetius]